VVCTSLFTACPNPHFQHYSTFCRLHLAHFSARDEDRQLFLWITGIHVYNCLVGCHTPHKTTILRNLISTPSRHSHSFPLNAYKHWFLTADYLEMKISHQMTTNKTTMIPLAKANMYYTNNISCIFTLLKILEQYYHKMVWIQGNVNIIVIV
jgi:hypothetical protein